MDTELLWQGAELMLVGMGTVFAFLTLLVVCTASMSRLVLVWQGAAEPPATEADDAEVTAAIAAALSHHRRRR